MIGRLAVALAFLGLLIAGYFVRRGPLVSTRAVELRWAQGERDAGEFEVQFNQAGVEFITESRDGPELGAAVLRRGEQVLELDGFAYFHFVEIDGARLWALAQSSGVAASSFALLVSEDSGRTFEARGPVPLPAASASLERWVVRGDELTIVLTFDAPGPLRSEWVWPWRTFVGGPAVPTAGPGQVLLRSTNGGRSWRLEP